MGAATAFALPVLVMGTGYNDNLLAVCGLLGAISIGLIMVEWTRV